MMVPIKELRESKQRPRYWRQTMSFILDVLNLMRSWDITRRYLIENWKINLNFRINEGL